MPFSDVIGHKRVIAWLSRQVAAGTVHHAYLLSGPDGVGKRFLARQLAQALQCAQSVAGDACGQCPMCRLVAAGHHPDVLAIDILETARQVKIEQIRQLQQWLAFTPFHGRRKVAMIDGADVMQEAAASALLKTLEEPPPTAVLVLIATYEPSVLPTIVSRCARLACGPLAPEHLRAALLRGGLDPQRVDAVLPRAAGRLSRARRLVSDEAWERQRATVEGWVALVDAGDPEVPWAGLPRAEVEDRLDDVAAWYRDLLFARLGLGDRALAYPDCVDRARAQAARQPPEALLAAIDAVYAARLLVQQHVNPRTALAALIARLVKPVTSDQ